MAGSRADGAAPHSGHDVRSHPLLLPHHPASSYLLILPRPNSSPPLVSPRRHPALPLPPLLPLPTPSPPSSSSPILLHRLLRTLPYIPSEIPANA
eukprot:2949546-Pyramimonas_sp.AAC.1